MNLDAIIVDDKTDLQQLTLTLEDVMTTAVVSRVDIVPWLLTELVDGLKTVVSSLQPVVPQDFYLPAPPLYCPQPTQQVGVVSWGSFHKTILALLSS